MKTIAFNRSRGTWLTTVLVLGGLTGLYFYRRQGGKISTLFTGAFGSVKAITDRFTSAEGDAEELVGGLVHGKSVGGKAREIATSPEDMDRLPAT